MIRPPVRGTGLLLSALLLPLCALTACLPSPMTEDPPVTQSAPSPLPEDETSLRTYYEALIADLNQALLEATQENYIQRKGYEQQIAELEARIDALQDPTDPPDETPDLSVSAPPTPPSETTPVNDSSFSYTVEGDSITILAYRGEGGHVTVPPSIGGLPVTRLADEAFRATAVTAITLPEGITEIGWFTFSDCPNLTALTLPSSVTAIGYGAFDNCPGLTILCPRGSYAHAYAQSFALPVMASDGAS